MNNVYNEEESKRARIFQREKRQELQLIIERCNQIKFEYVKVPSERNDNVIFGSSMPREIHFYADKSVNSYMRRCFKEQFSEPSITTVSREIELKPSAAFVSKVQRFQENLAIDSLQSYRRKKKVQETVQCNKINNSIAFGSSTPRVLMCTRDVNVNEVPACSLIPLNSNKKYENIQYSFGGKILIDKAYEIICSPKNLESKCHDCECEAKNVYWKSSKTHMVLCRKCYNNKLFDIKNKSRGIVEKFKNLQVFGREYKKNRHCSFYHLHKNSKASISILTQKEFFKQRQKENFLNTFMKY